MTKSSAIRTASCVVALLSGLALSGPAPAQTAPDPKPFDPAASIEPSGDLLKVAPPAKPARKEDDVRPGPSGGRVGVFTHDLEYKLPVDPGPRSEPTPPSGPDKDPEPVSHTDDNPNQTGGGFVPQGGGFERQPTLSAPGVSPTPIPPPPAALPDVAGDPDNIVAGEILVVSNSVAEATALAQTLAPRGLTVLRRQNLGFLGGVVLSAFRVPAGRAVADVLQELRQDLPQVFAGPNILFSPSGRAPRRYARKLIGWPSGKGDCGQGLTIGVIDTGLDSSHPALAEGQASARSFLPAGLAPASADHGTAVAALLVGRAESLGFGGLLPGARLTLAAVFHETRKGRTFATTERVVLALNWLGTQGLRLVNLSLSGPSDQLLALAMSRAAAGGLILVAAAGNGGADAPPAYPAAHPDVVAVTAVDAALEPYDKANRGDYIDFAAPGVDVWSARTGGSGSYHSGTSFAVPFVLAALAAGHAAQPGADAGTLTETLRATARDLGRQGKDPVFGWGLIQQGSCGPSLTATK